MALRVSTVLRRLAVLGVSFAVTLLLVEGGYRGWLAISGHSFSAQEKRGAYLGNLEWLLRPGGAVPGALTEEDAVGGEESSVDPLATIANLATSDNVLSPYLGVDMTAALGAYVERGLHFGTDAAARDFDVLVLGGSVAAILAQDGAEALRNALGAAPELKGRRIRIWNQARGGFKAPQTSILAGLLFQLGWKPDAVVLIDGFNELALGNTNRIAGASPLYPSFPHWAHLAGGAYGKQPDVDALVDLTTARRGTQRILRGALKYGLYRSAVCSRLVDVWLTRPRARASRAMKALEASRMEGGLPLAMRGPLGENGEGPADLGATLDAIELLWIESSVSLDAMCRVRGIPYLHVLQPTLYDEGAKPITPSERQLGKIEQAWLDAVVDGYPRLRRGLVELEGRGVATFDASAVFAEWTSDLYYDCCHFGKPGSEELARQVVARLLAVPVPSPR